MKIILISHGNLCKGMKQTLSMFAATDSIATISLNESGIEEFSEQLAAELDYNQENLIIADIEGGSPYQAAVKFKLENKAQIEIVSGMNLPMVIEAVLGSKFSTSQELKIKACEAGKQAVVALELNKIINNEDE